MGAAPFISRQRLSLRGELLLALPPTLVVLGMLAGVEAFSRQRLLFASLASSAFLIYLDPDHPANAMRTVVIAQGASALLGFGAFWFLGSGYLAAGVAMVLTVVLMVSLDATHPPAVSTALTFAFRPTTTSSLSLFGLSTLLIVLLIVLQKSSSCVIRRHLRRTGRP